MANNKTNDPKTRAMGLFGFVSASAFFFKPYWKQVGIILAALLIQAAFRAFLPIGYSQIFDGAIAHSDTAYVWQILVLLSLAWAIHLVAGLVQDRYTAGVGARVLNDFRLRMFAHLQRLPSSFHDKRDSGDLMSLFSNDLAAIETAYLRAMPTVLFSFIVLVASVTLLFVIEWHLALITFACLPIALIGPRILSGKAQTENYQRKNSEAEISAVISENIGASVVIRVFGLQKLRLAAFRADLGKLATSAKRAYVTSSLIGRTSSQTIQLLQIGVMGFGGYLSINGHLTIGSLVGFVALLLNVSNAANYISSAVPDLLPASAALQRINEFLDARAVDLERSHDVDFPPFSQIRFDKVCFVYDQSKLMALKKISFSIPAGTTVAIVGPSGCGKSTILNLILRLYQPSSGKISVDDIDLTMISETSLRKQTSVVMQDTILFNSSFYENICMGNPEIDQTGLEEVARQAEIHEFINSLAQGYETQVGEWGGNLSGGQRQRIAIARAILHDPALLILDEATSALDSATEAAVNETLTRFGRGRTVISTTHRLRTIIDVDLILVVEDGRVVEQGTHDQLLARGGTYTTLWEKQSGFSFSTEDGVAEVTPNRLMTIPLLSGINEDCMKSVASMFVTETLPADRIVFMKGDRGDKFYIIVRGTVEVQLGCEDDGKQYSRLLQDGDYFGEMALLERVPRNATIRTLANTVLLSLSRFQFKVLLDEEPNLRKTIEKEAQLRHGAV